MGKKPVLASLAKPVLQGGLPGVWKHRLQGPHVNGDCRMRVAGVNRDFTREYKQGSAPGGFIERPLTQIPDLCDPPYPHFLTCEE